MGGKILGKENRKRRRMYSRIFLQLYSQKYFYYSIFNIKLSLTTVLLYQMLSSYTNLALISTNLLHYFNKYCLIFSIVQNISVVTT